MSQENRKQGTGRRDWPFSGKFVGAGAMRRRLGAGMLAFTMLLSACGTEAAPTATPVPPAAAEPTATVAAAAPAPAGDQLVNMLWTDNNNLRQPVIADCTKATGIKVNQAQVQENALLHNSHTAV